MPLQNRVTPFGEIIAVLERGTLMGNRGILHDDAGRIVRSWQVRRWIACRTAFRGRQRQLLQPHSWTELLLPRRGDGVRRRPSALRRVPPCRLSTLQGSLGGGSGAPNGADEMDAVVHADRLEGRGARQCKRTNWEQLASLPEGVFIRLDGSAWLLWGGQLLEWSAGGYSARRQLLHAASRVEVLTPHSLVAVLRARLFAPGPCKRQRGCG